MKDACVGRELSVKTVRSSGFASLVDDLGELSELLVDAVCGRVLVNVEVIENYGSYMRLRVQRHNKTIGFLFKLIEELKEEHQLEDYSVSQTTLEQIFQGFADLKFNENAPTYCIDEESGELAKIVFE